MSSLHKLESNRKSRRAVKNLLLLRKAKMRNEPIFETQPEQNETTCTLRQTNPIPHFRTRHAPCPEPPAHLVGRASRPALAPAPPEMRNEPNSAQLQPPPCVSMEPMLVLASQSPRRAEILRQAGIPFIVRSAPVDETPLPGERPEDYVQRLAEAKALAIPAAPDETVLGADTTVVVEGEMLGKPLDAADARRMLAALAGRRHEVLTGICLRNAAGIVRDWAATGVWFAHITAPEIDEYIAGGEPMDKAGAYAIQGLASKFIERIDGCYCNVVGLPVAMVYHHLRELAPHMLG